MICVCVCVCVCVCLSLAQIFRSGLIYLPGTLQKQTKTKINPNSILLFSNQQNHYFSTVSRSSIERIITQNISIFIYNTPQAFGPSIYILIYRCAKLLGWCMHPPISGAYIYIILVYTRRRWAGGIAYYFCMVFTFKTGWTVGWSVGCSDWLSDL
jgi:hypothetical protein